MPSSRPARCASWGRTLRRSWRPRGRRGSAPARCGWTLQRAREAQQRWQEALDWTYGSARSDLSLESAEALARSLEQKIPADVRRDAQLDVGAVAATFARRCAEILALPEAEQWRIGVHGKAAFKQLLVPALRSTPREARFDLAERIDRPPPIDELLALLLL